MGSRGTHKGHGLDRASGRLTEPGAEFGVPSGFAGRIGGFTLIELVMVMLLLAVVMGVVAPALSRFFSGRSVDEETRRFVALTRFARGEAISSGFPVLLWIDKETGRYGLTRAGSSPNRLQGAAVLSREYALPKGVELLSDDVPLIEGTNGSIRFLPDGTIDSASVEYVVLRDKKADRLLGIRRLESRPAYEIVNLYENELPSTVR